MSIDLKENALPGDLEQADAADLVRWAIHRFGTRLAIVTSFQVEGMVVVDMAARVSRSVRLVTLDTGRLPPETTAMMREVRERYGVEIETVHPEPAEIEAMVRLHGPDLFLDSVPRRMLCCHLRKVRPLERKLAEFDAWIAGLRRGQSETRGQVQRVEYADGRLKLSPLADWTSADVEAYTRAHGVPRHPLYAQGYTSIGCAPCTRATRPGEDERAGRWWWEQGTARECGIHFSADGKAERTVDVLLREVLQDPR